MAEFEPKLLIIEDQPAMLQMLEEYLTGHGFQVSGRSSADDALAGILSHGHPDSGITLEQLIVANPPPNEIEPLALSEFDAVLTDLKMPGTGGIEFCRQLGQLRSDLPVIVMTAFGNMETAIEAIRAGAFDFVTKPVELELLLASLRRATETSRLRRRLEQMQSNDSGDGSGLIGQSDIMLKLKQKMLRMSESSASILLTGESGSGKEVAAQFLHQHSERRDKPFVAVNCAALPETLMESELFGHVKGAFTDAKQDRQGLFLEANGGTLFLDEIGELPLELQPKLLRALEQKTVRPVGGKQEFPFDVRLLTATNRDLEDEIEAGRFRSDLFYRINVLELNIPPLRDRGMDILLLANHFLDQLSSDTSRSRPSLSPSAGEKLLAYAWPGNVRELRNVMERATVLSSGKNIEVEDLPEKIRTFQHDELVIAPTDHLPLLSLDDMQRRYIDYVLQQTDGNKTEAARILGVDRKTLYRKLKDDADRSTSP